MRWDDDYNWDDLDYTEVKYLFGGPFGTNTLEGCMPQRSWPTFLEGVVPDDKHFPVARVFVKGHYEDGKFWSLPQEDQPAHPLMRRRC